MERSTWFFLVVYYYCCMASFTTAAQTKISTDQSALLALKSRITDDPRNKILSNWSTTTHVCNWAGVTCGAGHLRVTDLNISYFGLAGTIAPELGNLSFLVDLDFTNNSFHGSLPQELASLRRLKFIDLEGNHFEGIIPSWLGLLSKLQTINLYDNKFSSSLPTAIFNLSALQIIDLRYNHLSGSIPREIENLTMLKEIYLDYNKFKELPNELGNLDKLEKLWVQSNSLQGHLPVALFNMSSLTTLTLDGNNLSGSLTNNIHLPNIEVLLLSHNNFDGPIPSTLWQCKQLLNLSLKNNHFSGSMSNNIGNLTNIKIILLGYNNLTDSIGNLKVVGAINLANNRLSGNISSTIGGLQALVILSLANNGFEGAIPSSFGELLSLEICDLSKNNLSGIIPKSLEALSYLRYLNLSFNKLQGEIPTGGTFLNLSDQSFLSNEGLCGAPRFHVPPCKRKGERSILLRLKYIIPGIISALFLVSLVLILILRRKKKAEVARETTLSPQLQEATLLPQLQESTFLPRRKWRRVSYQELLSATNGFDECNLLGTGAFGTVYRGTLSDGINVAIKVFKLELERAFTSFELECEVLSNICHRNLIKVISCCSQIDFKAIVLNYMPNGSLEKWLYSPNFSFNVLQRLNIMVDVASALQYLHHGYDTPIVHCDLKPSNILLDDDMVAYVSDFGIAKVLGGEDPMTQTLTLATIGYMAPEYGLEGIVTRRGDVYSFGILLLETFTKRKPTDEMFNGEMSLKQWVENALSADAIVEVVDATLLGIEEDHAFVCKRECISAIMRLALACCAESLEERINMQDALAALDKIRIKFLMDAAGGVVKNHNFFRQPID